MNTIKSKERTAILDSLKAGVVPRIGLQHIQVGRSKEITELIRDFNEIKEGASKIRFIIGEFGSGKSFFLTLAMSVSHEYNFISTKIDVTTEKVLYSRENKAQSLYTEIIKNLSTKIRPDGGALKIIIETWIEKKIGINKEVPADKIESELSYIKNFVSGYDFSSIVTKYYEGFITGDDRLMNNCIRWLSGEYQTKTDALHDLGVRSIITDENYYDYIKLLSQFIKDAGYTGLQICIDELAVLARLNSQTRTRNYETILKIYNDCLQGQLSGIYYLFGGTPEFLRHPTKGLYSYGALKTRLSDNPFADSECRDLSGPIIELNNLTQEELFAVFCNIRNVFSYYDNSKFLIDDSGITEFMKWIFNRLGAESFLSPREAIKNYVNLLSQIENYPQKTWRDFLSLSEPSNNSNQSSDSDGLTKLNNLKL